MQSSFINREAGTSKASGLGRKLAQGFFLPAIVPRPAGKSEGKGEMVVAVLIILLILVVVVLFVIGSVSQSAATAIQAQAQIETARAAQISAAGQTIGLFWLGVIATMAVLALLVIAGVYFYRRWKPAKKAENQTALAPKTADPNAMIGMMMMAMMQQLMRQNQQPPTIMPQNDIQQITTRQEEEINVDWWQN